MKKKILDKGFKKNNIIIYGHLNKKRLNTVYSKSEIFLMPSLFESFSIPLLEACYFKNIILSSDTGATKETTCNRAIYFNNKNLKDLKNKILYISNLKSSKKNKILNYQSKMLINNNNHLDYKNFKLLINSL